MNTVVPYHYSYIDNTLLIHRTNVNCTSKDMTVDLLKWVFSHETILSLIYNL